MSTVVGWRPRQMSRATGYGPPSRIHYVPFAPSRVLPAPALYKAACGAWLPALADVKDGNVQDLSGVWCARCAAKLEAAGLALDAALSTGVPSRPTPPTSAQGEA